MGLKLGSGRRVKKSIRRGLPRDQRTGRARQKRKRVRASMQLPGTTKLNQHLVGVKFEARGERWAREYAEAVQRRKERV